MFLLAVRLRRAEEKGGRGVPWSASARHLPRNEPFRWNIHEVAEPLRDTIQTV